MAKKISQLTQATEVKSDDVTVIVQDGETKKLPLNMMVTKQDIENKKIAGLAKLDEIEATYENDTYTPTITVKNKSSVKTGEGDEVDYSANVVDGHAKSAILSGNTLVNLINVKNATGGIVYTIKDLNLAYELPVGKYILFYDIIKANTSSGLGKPDRHTPIVTFNDGSKIYQGFEGFNTSNGKKYWIINATTPIVKVEYWLSNLVEDGEVDNLRLFAYQDGMENWDIPYFTGMQSVKMPVLTTTGKNLFDKTIKPIYVGGNGVVTYPNGNYGFEWQVVKPNTSYVLSYNVDNNSYKRNEISYYTKDKVYIKTEAKPLGLFTTPNNAHYIVTRLTITNEPSNIQLEEGTVATSYEPFKSNILTVNEDVTLRGIGDVKDTLDLLTGEMTERIGEIVLDGSEEWQKNNTDFISFYYRHNESLSFSKIITDNYPIINSFEDKTNGIFKGGGAFGIIKNDIENVEQLKQWLSQNPITVQYQLSTESIKTVDLMPSGTHPSTTPYCWKNGHIQLSSSGLLPSLEYSVVTSRAGQISQNATMIVKNDKRIFDLEILLAGGLVNTTYQALTLQNQVETGLSKVSLNSETEPDYLLYHMIMKLIEEKAYKLDDLTEKVSVFYLYEKLSDEQFETIYSALYPFVEDEIVEEPVVEELPEVVEDEVIM